MIKNYPRKSSQTNFLHLRDIIASLKLPKMTDHKNLKAGVLYMLSE